IADDQTLVSMFPNESLKNIPLFLAKEGTVLRVFWDSDQWFISTHQKIDAHNSRWSGGTFGSMFDELRTFNFDNLNKDWCYVFLLRHEKNKIIYPVFENELILLSVYSKLEKR